MSLRQPRPGEQRLLRGIDLLALASETLMQEVLKPLIEQFYLALLTLDCAPQFGNDQRGVRDGINDCQSTRIHAEIFTISVGDGYRASENCAVWAGFIEASP